MPAFFSILVTLQKHTFWHRQQLLFGVSLLRVSCRHGLEDSVLAYQTKSQGSSSSPDIKTKYKKVFLRRFPLSKFLAKTLRVNKIAMKSFSKNLLFGVAFKLQVPPLMKKINIHNISGVRNQVNNPDWRVVIANYVCVCVSIASIVLSFIGVFSFGNLKISAGAKTGECSG